jgi:hypothetical protein
MKRGWTREIFVVQRIVMDALSEKETLHRLETWLKPRIEEAERGEVVNQAEIVAELKQERDTSSEGE